MVPGLISTFMQLAWGRISDRLRHSWGLVSTGFILTSVLSIPVILSTHPWQVIATAGIQAFFGSMTGVAVVVRLADVLEPSRRARFMSIYNPMGFAGNIIGSFYTGFMVPHIGYSLTFLGYTVLNLALALFVRYTLTDPRGEPSLSFSSLLSLSIRELGRGLRELPDLTKRGGDYTRWCLGISVRALGIAIFTPVQTLYLVRVLQASKPQIGSLNSLALALQLVSSPPLGWAADRRGTKRIMLAGVSMAALFPLLFMMTSDVAQLIPVYVISGVYWACITSTWFAWQMNLIPEKRGLYTGLLNFINGMMWALGPLLGGLLGDYADIWVSAVISSMTMISGFLILLRVPENRARNVKGD